LITNYKPISLINCSFKIIIKLLADRLAKVMDFLINYSQTTYIKGRYIMDNVVCAHEILHQVKISKLKEFFLRLILKKHLIELIGFFLIKTIQGRGFGSKWIRWIQNILDGSKTYINFNGELGLYFHCKRGVRQDDPLSHFLFDLVADVLNVLLNNAQDKGYIKGLWAKGTFSGLVNVHFADDILLFLEVNAKYIESLK
jgi:Reverse transcriptase (RNA-dependent DNA polymerase)